MQNIILVFCVLISNVIAFKSRTSHNLLTCFTCSGVSCSQPFNLSEPGIYSSLCADGCVVLWYIISLLKILLLIFKLFRCNKLN